MVNSTIGSGGGFDHVTPQEWETDTDNNLPSQGAGQEGEGFDESNFTANVTFAGGTQDPTFFRQLYASPGEEFNPIDLTGCYLVFAGGQQVAQTRDDYLRVEHWGFENTDTAGGTAQTLAYHSQSSFNTCIGCTFIKRAGTSGNSNHGCVVPVGDNHEFYSCIFIGSNGVGNVGPITGLGLALSANGAAYNCVVFGINNGTGTGTGVGLRATLATNTAINNASFDCEGDDFSFISGPTENNNASSDTTGSTAALRSLTAIDEFTAPGSEDFTLLVGGTLTLEDAGANSPGSFDDSQVVGDDHVATFEIGAYNFSAVATDRVKSRTLLAERRTTTVRQFA